MLQKTQENLFVLYEHPHRFFDLSQNMKRFRPLFQTCYPAFSKTEVEFLFKIHTENQISPG